MVGVCDGLIIFCTNNFPYLCNNSNFLSFKKVSMLAIADIKDKLTEETYLISRKVESEDFFVDDESLDFALECSGSINFINEIYHRVFDSLDNLTKLKADSTEELEMIETILSILKKINRESISLWIGFDNNAFLKVACKSALFDLRINIRTLKEYIEDTNDVFFLNDNLASGLDGFLDAL